MNRILIAYLLFGLYIVPCPVPDRRAHRRRRSERLALDCGDPARQPDSRHDERHPVRLRLDGYPEPAVASVYHAAYDEVRDALEKSIGFGPLVSIWEMATTTIFGAILLWKANWAPLLERKDDR